jgi:hypothetical protein
MSGVRDAANKGLGLGVAAIRHAGWWLRWQADRRGCREVAVLVPPPAGAQRPVA